MTTHTDETDQRHRYECDPCDRRGPLRDDRAKAARDAQQHDIGFHDGTLTCDLVQVVWVTPSRGSSGRTHTDPDCHFLAKAERAKETTREHAWRPVCGTCQGKGQTDGGDQTLNQLIADPDVGPEDLLTDGGVPLGDRNQCPHCSASFPARRSARREANELVEHIENIHAELVTDGGLERPPFVDPDVEVVECHFCHETWPPEAVDGFDLSAEDEYYPRMVPVCPEHVAGGCR